jgi:prepilin-type N-terminal cleavage/methylation domain-containing protein
VVRQAAAREGFTLIEVVVGMAMLGLVLVGLASYSKSQRNSLHKTNKFAYASQAAAIYTERQKTWFADTTLYSAYGNKTRYHSLYAAVGASYVDSNWTWSPSGQGAGSFQVKIRYSKVGGASDYLLKGTGTITWDATHTFTWGFLMGLPRVGSFL